MGIVGRFFEFILFRVLILIIGIALAYFFLIKPFLGTI